MWPFKRHRRGDKSVSDQLGELQVERQRLKIRVGQRVADDNPELAAALLWGGSKGAQAFVTKEKSLAERYFEKRILGEDDDPLEKLERIRRLIREERDDMDLDDTPGPTTLERAVQTFLPVIAAALNPAGFQQAMAAQQPQLQITEAPAVVSSSSAAAAFPPPAATASSFPQSPPVEATSTVQTDVTGAPVYAFPVRVAVVLSNLESMTPDAFTAWALGQPALARHMQALAAIPDEQLAQLLAQAEANPLLGEFGQVFAWLRANPHKTTAIIQSLRMRTSSLPVEEDVAI